MITVLPLVPAKFAENVQTTQYTAPTGTRAIVDKATVVNTTSGAVSFSINVVPASGSVSDANLVLDARAISPFETYTLPELVGHVLEPGGYISTLASAPNALAFRVSGRQVT